MVDPSGSDPEDFVGSKPAASAMTNKMTVAQLRDILGDLPQDAEVCLEEKGGDVDAIYVEHLERIEGEADRVVLSSWFTDWLINRKRT